MKTIEKVGMCLLGSMFFGIGVNIGQNEGFDTGRASYSPEIAYTKKLEGDHHQYLILESRDVNKIILMDQEDGTYKTLEDVYKEKINKDKEKAKEWKNSIENKIEGVFGTI